MIGASVIILILVLVLLTYYFSRTEYELAFKNLNATDAAAVIQYLESNAIPYQLSNDGKSIGVPAALAAKVKIDAGSQGLVQNGSLGFGAFSKKSSAFGMTDNEFKVQYKDALNGEVQQLLNRMNGVVSSDVLIHIPDESVFLRQDQEQASASIVLEFAPGYRPTQEAIDGYFNLVKTAVPNLSIDNITISSQDGELMPSGRIGSANSSTIAEQQFAIQKQFEDKIRREVLQFLESIVGQDRVTVNVISSINFDQKRQNEQLVTPVKEADEEGIEISLEEIQKTYSGGAEQVGGVVGTGETDIPNYPAATDSGRTESEEITRRVNYEVNRISREIVSSPYSLKDLTINVGVEPPNADPDSLTPETLDAIRNILVNIVRASLADSGTVFEEEELSKKVFVMTRPFSGTVTETEQAKLIDPWWIGGAIAALALAGGVGYAVYRRRTRRLEEDEPIAEPLTEVPVLDLDQVGQENQVRKQLETLARKKPEEFVNLLRTWLVDE
jgi:flagellar M-ring protein FliF